MFGPLSTFLLLAMCFLGVAINRHAGSVGMTHAITSCVLAMMSFAFLRGSIRMYREVVRSYADPASFQSVTSGLAKAAVVGFLFLAVLLHAMQAL